MEVQVGNASSNSSGMMQRARRSTRTLDFAIPYTIASGTFSLMGGVSNFLVMFILVRYVGMKHNTYVYMLSLFLSDFLYNVVVQPQVCFYQFPTSTITLFGMYYIHGASLMCILTGASSLFFASLDKFIFIKFPFFYITKTKTRLVVVCVWIACVGLGVMRFFNVIFITDGYLAIIATLFVLTIFVQIMIFVVAREQEKRIIQVHRSLEHNHPHDEFRQSVTAPSTAQGSNKAARTIGLMLAVYISSWLPVNIYRFEYRWNGGNAKVYHTWIKVTNLLIQVHSCINPYIFVLRTPDMKIGLGKMMRSLGVYRLCKHLVGERAGGSDQEYIRSSGSNENKLTGSNRVSIAGQTDDSDVNRTSSSDDQSENSRGGNIKTSPQRNKEALAPGTTAQSEEIEGQHINSCSPKNGGIQTAETFGKNEENQGHEKNCCKSQNSQSTNEANGNGRLKTCAIAHTKDNAMKIQNKNSENKSYQNTKKETSDRQNQSHRNCKTNFHVGSGSILNDSDRSEYKNMEDLEMSRYENEINNVDGSSFGENPANINNEENDNTEKRMKISNLNNGN